MRQLRRKRAGAAARDDEHDVVCQLRQRVWAVRMGAPDGLNDLAADEVLLECDVVAGEGLHMTLQLLNAGQRRGAGGRLFALHQQKLHEFCAALQIEIESLRVMPLQHHHHHHDNHHLEHKRSVVGQRVDFPRVECAALLTTLRNCS